MKADNHIFGSAPKAVKWARSPPNPPSRGSFSPTPSSPTYSPSSGPSSPSSPSSPPTIASPRSSPFAPLPAAPAQYISPFSSASPFQPSSSSPFLPPPSSSYSSSSHPSFTYPRPKEGVSAAVIGEVLGIGEVLSDPTLCAAFQSFLNRAWMAETLNAYFSVQHMIDMRGNEERASTFDQFCMEFLDRSGPTPINIPDDIFQKAMSFYNSGNVTVVLLEELKSEIFLLLATSCIPPFLASREFKESQMDEASVFSHKKVEQFFGEKFKSIVNPPRK